MRRSLRRVYLAGLCLAAALVSIASAQQRDPGAIFKRLDTNNDQRLSREEFQTLPAATRMPAPVSYTHLTLPTKA